jgi:hypothetical protein
MLVQSRRRAHVFQHAHPLDPRGTEATLAGARVPSFARWQSFIV